MTNRNPEFKVHESTLRLMLPGMTMEELRNAALGHYGRPLTLVVEGDDITPVVEVTGTELFNEWHHLCRDYQGEGA